MSQNYALTDVDLRKFDKPKEPFVSLSLTLGGLGSLVFKVKWYKFFAFNDLQSWTTCTTWTRWPKTWPCFLWTTFCLTQPPNFSAITDLWRHRLAPKSSSGQFSRLVGSPDFGEDSVECRGAVAQMVERPSKAPGWCHSTNVGWNFERDISSFCLWTQRGIRSYLGHLLQTELRAPMG